MSALQKTTSHTKRIGTTQESLSSQEEEKNSDYFNHSFPVGCLQGPHPLYAGRKQQQRRIHVLKGERNGDRYIAEMV